jgi:flagellar basal body rod protein FlgG
MDGPSPVDAFERISARAEDLRDAFRPGGIPLHGDVTAAPRVLRSSDPLSVALPPGAWLVTSAADGTRAYTRDGALTVADGTVRTRDGAAVLGFAGGDARGSIAAPLQLPAADRALGRCDDAGIEADGSVVYRRVAIDPRTGERTLERRSIGRVALARFPAGSEPLRLDGGHVAAPRGVAPHVGTPGDESFGALVTASREAGSVDIAAGVERLNEAYRQFEALGAAFRSRASVQKTTLDLVK